MFNELINAINSIGNYCELEGCPNPLLKNFYKTEFYNEGWVLKLTLALLREMALKTSNGQNIGIIKDALHKGWMSEGRLSAAFTREQCTHADAVLGDIAVESHWGVTLNKDAQHFAIIEAKLGSKLADGTKNSTKTFSQAARNVACMAYAMLKANLAQDFRAHFFVLLPKSECHNIQDAKLKTENAISCIKNETQNNAKHKLRLDHPSDIEPWLEKIETHVVTWEDLFDEMESDASSMKDRLKALRAFYTNALKANGLPIDATTVNATGTM